MLSCEKQFKTKEKIKKIVEANFRSFRFLFCGLKSRLLIDRIKTGGKISQSAVEKFILYLFSIFLKPYRSASCKCAYFYIKLSSGDATKR